MQVILCINPYDEKEYIERTIQFIESAVNGSVIALNVFPMDLKSDELGIYSGKKPMGRERFASLKQELQRDFSLPVFLLGESGDMETLVDTIIDYFSEN